MAHFLNVSISSQQNNIQYELIGIGTALEYFTVVERSGEVKIRKKLREDFSRQPTYRVKNSLSLSFTDDAR